MQEKLKLEISTFTIVKVFLVMLAFYFLYIVRDIVALMFVVLILAAAFRPVVASWEKHIKRLPAVILLLVIGIALLSLTIYLIIPPVMSQIKQLIVTFPDFVSRYDLLRSYSPAIKEAAKSAANNIGNITGGVLNFTFGIFGGIITFASAIIMTVYLLLDEKNTKSFFLNLVPQNQQQAAIDLSKKVSGKVGDWFRGQLILGIIMGALVWLGLLILGVPYALTIGIVAGLLEIVPTIGPLISGIIAVLIALQVSPITALLTVVLFIVFNQLENSILVPKIMQKAVGLSPVIVILAVLTGAKILGITGAILAVPIAASIWVFIQEWPQIKETFNK